MVMRYGIQNLCQKESILEPAYKPWTGANTHKLQKNTMEALGWLEGVLNNSDLSVFWTTLNGDACIFGPESVGRKTDEQTLCVGAFWNVCVCVCRRDSNTECQKLEVTATIARIIIIKGTTRHNAHIKHKRENNLNRKQNKKSFCTVRAYGGPRVLMLAVNNLCFAFLVHHFMILMYYGLGGLI